MEIKAGEQVKTFKPFSFQVVIPAVTDLGGELQIRFRIQFREENTEAFVFDTCIVRDRLGNMHTSQPNRFIPKRTGQNRLECCIPYMKNRLIIAGAELFLIFLSQSGKKYVIHYISADNFKFTFDDITYTDMSEEEKQRFADCFSDYCSTIFSSKEEKEASSKTNASNGTKSATGEYSHPSMKNYVDALVAERDYLKTNGGKRYKVSNGRNIVRKNGEYTYSFEMDIELHLPDATPVNVILSGSNVEGNVIACESFQIVISLDKDIGSHIGTAFISVEPWKLLDALREKLNCIQNSDKLAVKLIEEGPNLATKDTSAILKGQDVAKHHAGNEDITIIWGPPGTGKTHTISEIVLSHLKSGKSVLVVSHSNVSVDGVVNKVSQMLKDNFMEDYLEAGKVLRYGYVRDEDLSKNPYAVSFNYALGKNPLLFQELTRLSKEKEAQLQRKRGFDAEIIAIEKKLCDIRARVREAESMYVDRAQFVATTISKVTIDPLFENRKFDVVMFDEISMAYVPQIVCAAMYAKERFIAVGDFRQLPPIAQSREKSLLQKDIFSYLNISPKEQDINYHPWLVMLNEQRRMHPAISKFSNRFVYRNMLRDHNSVLNSRENILKRQPCAGSAINLIDLFGTYCAAGKDSNNSRFNIISAIISFSTAVKALADGEKNIGIITPYTAQTRLIRAMIQDQRESGRSMDVSCSTVHQFQGSERNTIIFDAVESYPSAKPGWLLLKNENGSLTRLINVAVTRARGKLFVIANSRFWENKCSEIEHALYKLVRFMKSDGNVVGLESKKIQSYFNNLDFGKNIQFWGSDTDYFSKFKRDIEHTKKRIIVSIPDAKLNLETEKEIFDLLNDAAIRGIRVIIKTKDATLLPEHWKSISSESKAPVFPIIAIDDYVIWYGLPQSRLMFQEKNCGYTTVFHAVFRISGSRTVKLINSLSEIDLWQSTDGLGNYIKCPDCRSPQMLAKGKGKMYLKCSKCSHNEPLSSKSVNEYILAKHIACPRCGGRIYAAVGKYGLYVKCDKGHFLKPDEI